jgi:phytanoyl-CoA hydroxylase
MNAALGYDVASPDMRAYYERHGYAVARDLLPPPVISRLLDLYRRDIVPSRHPFFRQNTNAYQRNELTDHGFVGQSFLDIHDYAKYPQFSAAARDVFSHEALLESLASITGQPTVRLMQTMLFDLNAATPAHQDWYYLDSSPGGSLIAAWIALEDIDERAGRFYVMPGSQHLDFDPRRAGRTHAEWLAVIRNYVLHHRDAVSAPALRAGDVLFWNSRTIHGSLETQDPRFSRKSLTAHYLPDGFEFGNLFTVKRNIKYKSHGPLRYYRNQPDYSLWNRIKFSIKVNAYNNPAARETLRTVRRWTGGQ